MPPEQLILALKPLFDRHLSRNIAFRDLARCDAFPLFSATQDEAFNRFLLWPAPIEERDILPQIDRLVRDHNLGKMLVISVCAKVTGMWHGMVLIKPFRDGLEMALGLHPNVWNRGVVFKAGQAVIEIIRQHLPQAPLYVRVRPENTRMVRILDRYGFTAIDKTQETHATGIQVNLDVYLLHPENWVPYEGVSSY